MYIVFFSTNDVFKAEEKLKHCNTKCRIVPTPVTDKAYCGVCVQTEYQNAVDILNGMEFKVVA